MMSGTITGLAWFVAGIFILAVLVSGGLAAALLVLTFTIGLSIAGKERWLRWSVVFVTTSSLLGTLAYNLLRQLPRDSLLSGVLAFGFMPLAPVLLLWLAWLLRGRCLHPHQQRLNQTPR